MTVTDLDLALLNECVYYDREPSGRVSNFAHHKRRDGNHGFVAETFIRVSPSFVWHSTSVRDNASIFVIDPDDNCGLSRVNTAGGLVNSRNVMIRQKWCTYFAARILERVRLWTS